MGSRYGGAAHVYGADRTVLSFLPEIYYQRRDGSAVKMNRRRRIESIPFDL